eukprot:6199585-Pleurochrysis_carterae.AAC.10
MLILAYTVRHAERRGPSALVRARLERQARTRASCAALRRASAKLFFSPRLPQAALSQRSLSNTFLLGPARIEGLSPSSRR